MSRKSTQRDDEVMSSGKRDDVDGNMVPLESVERTSPIDSSFFSDNLDKELEMLSERSLRSQEGSPLLNLTLDDNREEEAKEAMSLYLRQSTVASSNVTCQYEEAARIKNSFSGVHHSSVKSLPRSFKPGAVAECRKKNATNNLNKVEKTKIGRRDDGLFSPLRYGASEYKKEVADKRESDRVKRIHGLAFSRKPFTYASSPIRLKNEDLFGNETYAFPVPDMSGRQVDLKDCVRTDFVDGSKFLHGPFAVCANKSGDKEVSREEGVNWCKDIYNNLKEDWGHLRFSIKYSTDDEIIVSFDVDKLINNGKIDDSTLCKYMSRLTTHGVAAQHRLKKRGDRWRIIEDVEVTTKSPESDEDVVSSKEVLVFTYMAPWCKDLSLKVKRNAATNNRLNVRKKVLKNRKSNKDSTRSQVIT